MVALAFIITIRMCTHKLTTLLCSSVEDMLVFRITVDPDLTDVAVRGTIIFNGQKEIVHRHGCLSVAIHLTFTVKVGQVTDFFALVEQVRCWTTGLILKSLTVSPDICHITSTGREQYVSYC